jgi:hypothetical protein
LILIHRFDQAKAALSNQGDPAGRSGLSAPCQAHAQPASE